MAQVEEMFGIIHGGNTSLFGVIELGQFEVRPSRQLTDNLLQFPAGTRIGIEDFPPEEFNIDDINAKRSKRRQISVNGSYYWDRIRASCDEFGLEIVYLDDFPTWRRSLEKQLEVEALVRTKNRALKRLENQAKSQDPNKTFLVARDYNERIHRALIEAQYIHEVEREEKIVDNIMELSPSVVILGQGHGDYMMLNRSEFERRGLIVGNYQQETIPESEWYFITNYEYDGPLSAKLIPAIINPQFTVDRELLIRRHRVVTEGRVLSDEQIPDYIGTWKLDCQPEGLFEVYVNEGNRGGWVTGVIQDCLGRASFDGIIGKKELSFDKVYDADFCDQDAVHEPVLYEGKSIDGVYHGEYSTRSGLRGKFVMNAGVKLLI